MRGKFSTAIKGSLFGFLALTISGCAQTPEKVLPYSVSEESYRSMDCDRLSEEAGRINAALDTEYENQRKARADDAAGVFFLGLPVASISGKNRSEEIARLKGELNAIEATAGAQGCDGVSALIADARSSRDEKKN